MRSDEVKLEKEYDITIRMLKIKVREDIGKKGKIAFNILFETAKKQITVIGVFFSSI